MPASNSSLQTQLLSRLHELGSCAVAFSAGVDSTVVAKAAQLALGNRAVAVTGTSHSMAAGELEQARELAALIGIRHVVLSTHEFADDQYLRNAPDRCYHCKTELYSQLAEQLPTLDVQWIVNGANADDLGDYRPGMQAAQEFRVVSPLAECGFTKVQVRAIAQAWELPIWDKPAMPCLSSRVAYGEEVTPARLAMIDGAEQFLRSLGLRTVRVRYHRGDLARIELPLEELVKLHSEAQRVAVSQHLRQLGFKFVTLDLEGFRSGSLNQLVELSY
jgi:pyridinium-3,5-biscarboxylic acid mononucleotide sulfurtransferase